MFSQPKSKYYDEKLKIVNIRNLPMNADFKKEYVEDAMDYMSEDDDIIICSYPKTGTTWVSYILWKIIHKHETLPNLNEMTTKHIPFLEFVGTESVKSLPFPRVYKHHLPYSHMKVNRNAKYIYVYRNPMDTVFSYYQFSLKLQSHPLEFVTFDYFFESFLKGQLSWGNYFDHVLQFYEHRNNSHLLLISYEDLHRDKKEQILRIAKFLGNDYYLDLLKNETLLQEIMTETEFNHMKQNIDSNVTSNNEGQSLTKDIGMFRKGVIGDGKNSMKPEQKQKLEIQMIEKMKNTEILNHWMM